ncbi:MAG: transketolase [bacterium]|nr:transketolase [bacterium]
MAQYLEDEIENFQPLAKQARRDILEMIYRRKAPHIGCSFSIVDILTVLYFKILKVDPKNPSNPGRDRFILSKGHAVPALYAILYQRGFLDKEFLNSFAVDGGSLEAHPDRNILQGIEASTGSLGHGLSLGAGMALTGKRDKANYRVFTLLGDGELDEGSCWEAIMFASHNKLDNLVAIVDKNQCQILGRTSEVLELEPLADKWRSFGWATKEIGGHDFKGLLSTLSNLPFEVGKPSCIIANTTKGKGVSFMENEIRWHDKHPDEEEYKIALSELN